MNHSSDRSAGNLARNHDPDPAAGSPSSAVNAAGASLGAGKDLPAAVHAVLRGASIRRAAPRLLPPAAVASIKADVAAYGLRHGEGLLRGSGSTLPAAERIFSILRRASISRGKTRFDDSIAIRPLRQAIEAATQKHAPLTLALLLGGGKAPNELKTGGMFMPDSAEWTSLSMLAGISRAIGAIYPPGATMIAIPDASLHTGDLGFPYTDVIAHQRTLAQDVRDLGLADLILVPNTPEYLPDRWTEAARLEAERARFQLRSDSAFAKDVREQIESLAYSVNTREFGWSFEHTVLVYAALAGHLRGIPAQARTDAAELYHRVEQVAPAYVGVNRAIRSQDLVGSIVTRITGRSSHLRLSVHAKAGEPRPALVMPNRHAPMAGMLPMHSLGVLERGADAVHLGNTFELSARLNGMTPVWSAAEGRFLYFAPASDHHGDGSARTPTVSSPPYAA